MKKIKGLLLMVLMVIFVPQCGLPDRDKEQPVETKDSTSKEREAASVVRDPKEISPGNNADQSADGKPATPAEGDSPEPEEKPDSAEEIADEAGADTGKEPVLEDLFLAEGEGLKLSEIVLARGVEKVDGKKLPLDPGDHFTAADTERLTVFMKVVNPESLETELSVSFLSPDGATERGKVQVSIPARPSWSTRAFYRIRGPSGKWAVIVRHGEEVVARAPFEFSM